MFYLQTKNPFREPNLTPSSSLAVMFIMFVPGTISSHIVALKGSEVNCGTDGFLITFNYKVAEAVSPWEPLSYAVMTSCKGIFFFYLYFKKLACCTASHIDLIHENCTTVIVIVP